ncbi:protoporphyrinogen oxidase HemJ [Saccharospirillum impatiens]|uniref:protoporphyrinogen oxidase HemJ n=1 Tax=Saccharospirillum impatiens TaxID=169438 RepID=UPI0003F97F22|nr:protoporphyrinogen oxidase HemJ [Saccharospirillum impatiens]
MLYLWLKAFHIIAVITWFAALFYLPRLFVYHAMADDSVSKERFKIMERKLYRGIMTPSMVVTVTLGIAMLVVNPAWLSMGWMHAKLFLVVLLLGYHHACSRLLKRLAADDNRHSHTWYRWFNEAPVLVLVGIVLLVVLKPF